jgi:ATP-dependent DNA ligase
VTFVFPNKPIRVYQPDVLTKFGLDGWIVQPKWDGHRVLPYCDKDGKITAFSRHGRPLALAANDWDWLSMLQIPRPWLLDGELTRSGRMIIWDYGVLDGDQSTSLPYDTRLTTLQAMLSPLKKGGKVIELVETLDASEYEKILAREGEPDLEGVVFKRRNAKNLWGLTSTSEVPSQVKYRFR